MLVYPLNVNQPNPLSDQMEQPCIFFLFGQRISNCVSSVYRQVARVRESATEVLVAILRALNASENPELAQNLVRIVVEAQAMDGKQAAYKLCTG